MKSIQTNRLLTNLTRYVIILEINAKEMKTMSYRVYPVTETELKHTGYRIKINGQDVETNTARVSAIPFNRRWPGHQRSEDQTELINFISLETDEPLDFEIIPEEKPEKTVIRPLNLGIEPEIDENGSIRFTLEKPAYFTVEPYGRRNALHIFADPISNYKTRQNSPETLYFGKGEHDVGLIELKSGQTLFIDAGAVVYACIHAIDAENISIVGRGILDNSKNKERILFECNEENNEAAVNNAERDYTIQLEYCTNVLIDGITIRDSLVYNIRPIGCENLSIKNVKIIGCWRYNSDGIDMHNCINVEIDNCFLRTFDDSICVKGFDCYYDGDIEEAVRKAMYRNGKAYDTFKNVLVKNCVIWNDWGKCLEIGAETRAKEICDVLFTDCHIIHVTGPVLDCMNVDYADVHGISYKNISVELDDIIPLPMIQKSDNHRYEPNTKNYCLELFVCEVLFHKEYSAGGKRRGINRDLLIENISITGKHEVNLRFIGYSDEYCVRNINVRNIFLNGNKLKKENIKTHRNEYCRNINID